MPGAALSRPRALDRRHGERRGRPRAEIDLAYVDDLLEIGLTHHDVALDLHVHRATLERRLADRRRLLKCGLRIRCPECGTPCVTIACPNGHLLEQAPAFLRIP